MKSKHALIPLVLLCLGTAHAQSWSPKRNVEIVVGTSPGGTLDKTTRTLERLLVANKLVSVPITVVNKPGGGQNIAFSYASQRPGDGHTLMVCNRLLLTNHITGSSSLSYTDFAPIASLFNEYLVFAVNPASPIKTGKDLIERLKKDPKSVAIGIGSIGGNNHIAPALLMKAVGGNARDLKVVAHKGMGEATMRLLGGHLDLVTTPAGSVAPQVAAGEIRIVAVMAPNRIGGALADVPTWKEQGVDLVFTAWRAIIGPRGMPAAQTAFWENALRKATETAEWKSDLEKNVWLDDLVTGAQLRKDLEKDYADMRSVLTDLGLAKK